MFTINKYIFELCDKNIDMYFEITKTIRNDYCTIIRDFKGIDYENDPVNSCSQVRILAHKLVGVISILRETNQELVFVLNSLLSIHKTNTDILLYKPFVEHILDLDTSRNF